MFAKLECVNLIKICGITIMVGKRKRSKSNPRWAKYTKGGTIYSKPAEKAGVVTQEDVEKRKLGSQYEVSTILSPGTNLPKVTLAHPPTTTGISQESELALAKKSYDCGILEKLKTELSDGQATLFKLKSEKQTSDSEKTDIQSKINALSGKTKEKDDKGKDQAKVTSPDCNQTIIHPTSGESLTVTARTKNNFDNKQGEDKKKIF